MVYKSKWAPTRRSASSSSRSTRTSPVAELCRKHGVRPPAFYSWREKFFQGGKLALSGQLRDPVRETEAENERLKKLIGELTIANDAFKKTLEATGRRSSR